MDVALVEAEPASRGRNLTTLVGIVLGFALLRLVVAAALPLLRVETYYWAWSRQLAWGYKDHPPGVAVLIRAFSPILDNSVLGIRLGNVVILTIASFFLYDLCSRLVSRRAALWCVLAANLAPFWTPFGVAATPDGPLLFCWVVALWAFQRAWSSESLWLWVAAGVATALTILSKYNGFLLIPSFFTFLLLNERGRRLLRGPGPWIALAVTLVLIAPNLLWNESHAGSTIKTPFRKGIEPQEAAKNVGLFVLLPFTLLLPPLTLAWIWQTVVGIRTGRLWKDASFQLAVCTSWLPLAAFGVVSLLTLVHWQWPATCMVMALPVILEDISKTGGNLSPRCLRSAVVSTAGLVLLGGAIAIGAIAMAKPDPKADKQRGLARLALELRGWQQLDDRLREELNRRIPAEGDVAPRIFVASSDFHFTSHLDWRVRQRIPAFPLRPDRRYQYANWHEEKDFLGWNALCVEPAPLSSWEEALLPKAFENVERLDPITVTIDGVPMPRFEFFWCTGYLGTPE